MEESVIWRNGDAQREYEMLETLKLASTVKDFQSTIEELQRSRLSLSQERDLKVHTAFALGIAFGFGVLLVGFTSLTALGLYLLSVSIVHILEYSYAWNFHPKDASQDSYLLTNMYIIALGASFVEYFLELYFLPSLKSIRIVTAIGIIVMLGGQIIRTIAMWTAGSNFHHLVRERREKKHTLVRSGIYSVFRHPSYFGWYYWAVGTQVVLVNPICIAGFAYALWKFFDERIEHEEEMLIKFFGDDYRRYKKEVPTRIPFIN